ncbi:Gfo/Idh/MocA family protein [Paenibacillus durus]|uniref:Oxidoreductase n=1 Tax=Paenibacillus durus ATCC 35681 TaxID=1333534 RepID=A0A0F7F9Y1_PAEDU|nr:Gfo/Idh/MocA family oxidoreductase [Paenibacillus durus]AKG35298.1 oxidoreductase [Paenibacillus durus ATCC 35681]
MSKLNWAIIGPGWAASDFVKAIKTVNGSVYAVAGISQEEAQAFADKNQVEKAFGDYSEMLKDDAIDVVYISTPHNLHHKFIMESLKHGKHVISEKAITVNSEQLTEIIALAEEKNLVVAEAMTLYYMPLYKKLREILDSGQLGKLKMIQVSFGSCKEYDVKNRFFSKDLAGGALLDIGTYALSFTRFFLSQQPHEVLTTVKTFETGVDEQSGIILKNDADEMAVISLTMRAKMPKRGVVAGELGFITVDNFPRADKATITYTDGRVEHIEAGETAKALEYEVEDMQNFIQNKKNTATLHLSNDVMALMTNVRNQWGIKYPFE